MNLDTYAFSKQPGFVETEMRKAFKQAVPLRNRGLLLRSARSEHSECCCESNAGRGVSRRDCSG